MGPIDARVHGQIQNMVVKLLPVNWSMVTNNTTT